MATPSHAALAAKAALKALFAHYEAAVDEIKTLEAEFEKGKASIAAKTHDDAKQAANSSGNPDELMRLSEKLVNHGKQLNKLELLHQAGCKEILSAFDTDTCLDESDDLLFRGLERFLPRELVVKFMEATGTALENQGHRVTSDEVSIEDRADGDQICEEENGCDGVDGEEDDTTNETSPVSADVAWLMACPTISFQDVYQDGNAAEKHIIFQYPKNGGAWYIIRCEKHGRSFISREPIRSAASHIKTQLHGSMMESQPLAMRELGERVTGCNAELAEKNNSLARAMEDSTVMADSEVATTQQETGGKEARRVSLPRKPAHIEAPPFISVANPKPMEIHCVWDTNVWVEVLLLPLSLVTARTGIWRWFMPSKVPECYAVDHRATRFRLKPEFAPGGPRAVEREFPVAYLKDGDLSKTCWVSWVKARDMKEVDVNSPSYVSLSDPKQVVSNFLQKLDSHVDMMEDQEDEADDQNNADEEDADWDELFES